MKQVITATVLCLSAMAGSVNAGPVDPGLPFKLEEFVAVNEPIGVVFAPGDFSRAFVYTNPGVVHVVKDGVLLPDPFLDVSSEFPSNGEAGFFGLAFDPDYQNNGTFYIHYASLPGLELTLEKMQRRDDDHADPATRDVIYYENSHTQSHYGGWIGFHPTDGYMYLGMGDSGPPTPPPTRAQLLNTRYGKILRIDPSSDDYPDDDLRDFAIPADNPFVGQPDVRPEIFAYGIRQPWRCSFDRDNGDLWIGEVGRLHGEEINRIPNGVGGLNFGWPCKEGADCSPFGGCDCMTVDSVDPVHEYDRVFGMTGASVIGGYRYRGCEIPEIEGNYFFSDFAMSEIWIAEVSADNASFTSVTEISEMLTAPDGTELGFTTGWGEDAYGEIYVTDRVADVVYKLVRTDDTPVNDCNTDGIEDDCQILDGTLADSNGNGTPDVCDTNPCIGDCDNSGAVEFNDLVQMLFLFGQPSTALCDADESGTVDFNDLVTALFLFGPCK